MSWKEFIDGQLMMDIFPGYHLTASAIMDQEGYVWAQSETFPEVTAEEIASIMKGFSDTSHLAENGIFLGGTKYMLIQGEPGQVIRGKRGQGGVTVKKTHSALVIGIYDEPLPPSACNIVVEKLGDYLMEQNI